MSAKAAHAGEIGRSGAARADTVRCASFERLSNTDSAVTR
jgi:hypothetical protein